MIIKIIYNILWLQNKQPWWTTISKTIWTTISTAWMPVMRTVKDHPKISSQLVVLRPARLLGVQRKTSFSFSLSRRLARRSGPWSRSICRCGLGSSAGSGGTIILIPRSRSAAGAKRRSGYCSWCTGSLRISGPRSPKSWRGAPTTQSRITGIAQWSGS